VRERERERESVSHRVDGWMNGWIICSISHSELLVTIDDSNDISCMCVCMCGSVSD